MDNGESLLRGSPLLQLPLNGGPWNLGGRKEVHPSAHLCFQAAKGVSSRALV